MLEGDDFKEPFCLEPHRYLQMTKAVLQLGYADLAAALVDQGLEYCTGDHNFDAGCAHVLTAAGCTEQSIDVMRDILADYPQNDGVRGALITALLQIDEPFEAIEVGLTGHAQAGAASAFTHQLMKAYRRAGLPELAVKLGERELQTQPHDTYLHAALIAAYTDAGAAEQAIAFGRRMVATSCRNKATKTALMNAYLMNEEPERAINLGEVSLVATPTDPHMLSVMTKACMAARKTGKARHYGKRWRLADPSNMTAHYVSAQVEAMDDRLPAAASLCESALRVNPADRRCSTLLIAIYMQAERYADAIKTGERLRTDDNLSALGVAMLEDARVAMQPVRPALQPDGAAARARLGCADSMPVNG